jgi:hypothetical protein
VEFSFLVLGLDVTRQAMVINTPSPCHGEMMGSPRQIEVAMAMWNKERKEQGTYLSLSFLCSKGYSGFSGLYEN